MPEPAGVSTCSEFLVSEENNAPLAWGPVTKFALLEAQSPLTSQTSECCPYNKASRTQREALWDQAGIISSQPAEHRGIVPRHFVFPQMSLVIPRKHDELFLHVSTIGFLTLFFGVCCSYKSSSSRSLLMFCFASGPQ